MNAKTLLIAVLALSALLAVGFLGFWLGTERGAQNTTASVAAGTGAGTQVDPSGWGIAEGEDATRRHISEKLRAGDVDPLTGRKILHYHDPMVPGKKFEVPGESPFMDMMLVPAYAGGEGADSSSVTISPRIQQNLGVRTVAVTEGVLQPTLSAVGEVRWNERNQVDLQARAAGFVERLHVQATLDSVQRGQVLVELYVPDWVAAQEDFLALRNSPGPDRAELLDATRARMRQVGMNAAQIGQVERTGKLQTRLSVRAPIAGVVTELNVREGMTVGAGMALMRINGLASVWVEAEVPEAQIAQVRIGADVDARSSVLPGERFGGTVQAVLPEVDPRTRTVRVRSELANDALKLIPGMFVQVVMSTEGFGRTLLVPSEALIPTGSRTLLMIAAEDGSFRPVEVDTGPEADGQTVIYGGVEVGQKVVSSGQFLIDSEASLAGIEARTSAVSTSADEPSAPETHRGTAVIEAISERDMTLSHGPIASLQWPAMTMDFGAAGGLDTVGLSAGQEVEIVFRLVDGDVPEVLSIQAVSDHQHHGAGQ